MGPGKKGVDKGQFRLTAEKDTDTTVINTYVKILGIFADGCARNFEIIDDNKLKFIGPDNSEFLVNGTSDLSVNKACKTTYGLFINDALAPGTETPHSFPASARTQNISITGIVILNKNDEIDVHVKSDTLNTKITVSTLRVTFWGEK